MGSMFQEGICLGPDYCVFSCTFLKPGCLFMTPLVCLVCHKNHHELSGLHNRNSLLTVLEAQLDVRVSIWLVSGKSPLSALPTAHPLASSSYCIFPVYAQGACVWWGVGWQGEERQGQRLCWLSSSSYKATNPIRVGLLPIWPQLTSITSESRISQYSHISG